jgi:ribulose-phosphate 3-epimerase
MEKMIAPSILAADFSRMGDEVKAIEDAGAGWVHLDVMDGHFVPNLTMGPAMVKSLRSVTKLPFDAHLMVEKPDNFIEPFAKAGVDYISIHVETKDPAKTIGLIKSNGCKPGIVLNPPTDVEKVFPFLDDVDFVLVMTVNPGFAGQKMIEECVEKIGVLKERREQNGHRYLIQVDGGINLDTIHRVAAADVFVAGNGVFKAEDYKAAIAKMKQIVSA